MVSIHGPPNMRKNWGNKFGDSVYAYHDFVTRKNVGSCPLPCHGLRHCNLAYFNHVRRKLHTMEVIMVLHFCTRKTCWRLQKRQNHPKSTLPRRITIFSSNSLKNKFWLIYCFIDLIYSCLARSEWFIGYHSWINKLSSPNVYITMLAIAIFPFIFQSQPKIILSFFCS